MSLAELVQEVRGRLKPIDNLLYSDDDIVAAFRHAADCFAPRNIIESVAATIYHEHHK